MARAARKRGKSSGTQVTITGVKEATREFRKLGRKDLANELRDANKAAVEPVIDEAKRVVPARSGRLAKSIGNASTRSEGRIKAGTGKTVPYAGPIHFGWGKRNIKPQPFLYQALDSRFDEVVKIYDDKLQALARSASAKINRQ